MLMNHEEEEDEINDNECNGCNVCVETHDTNTHTTFDANEMSVKKKQTTIRKETSERPFLRPSGDQFEE
jgi:Na+-translocating ferredoxin:NAD+ oxidoreductase RNF subunit RnfB